MQMACFLWPPRAIVMMCLLLTLNERGIIPLDGLKISKSLAQRPCEQGCLIFVPTRCFRVSYLPVQPLHRGVKIPGSTPILNIYMHSSTRWGGLIVWNVGRAGKLVGGLYGVHLGGAFFGESMFSRRTDASKVALVHLVGRLNAGEFALLDTQFITPHLLSLGAVEISRSAYQARLKKALKRLGEFEPYGFSDEDFSKSVKAFGAGGIKQSSTQIS